MIAEGLGYLALVLVVTSSSMKTMIPLRAPATSFSSAMALLRDCFRL
jgi:hypothetical protein